jgi:hypothetical protein
LELVNQGFGDSFRLEPPSVDVENLGSWGFLLKEMFDELY